MDPTGAACAPVNDPCPAPCDLVRTARSAGRPLVRKSLRSVIYKSTIRLVRLWWCKRNGTQINQPCVCKHTASSGADPADTGAGRAEQPSVRESRQGDGRRVVDTRSCLRFTIVLVCHGRRWTKNAGRTGGRSQTVGLTRQQDVS